MIIDTKSHYMIAEIGHNHQGNIDKAFELFKMAKDCGANAVKLQKRDNKSLYTKSFYNSKYDNRNSYGETYGLHRDFLEFGKSEYLELKAFAKEIEIDFFATPFDFKSVEFLSGIDMQAFKIASADLTNTPLQIEIAKQNKKIFLSTGGGNIDDVKRARDNICKYTNDLIIMHCTASYPPNISEMNLNVIETYKKEFPKHIIGLSDHENGIDAGPVAYLLGARVFEKHVTLNRALKGTDHAFSLEPSGLKKFVRNLSRIPIMLGSHEKKLLETEKKPIFKMSKSIVASKNLRQGEILTFENIAFKSPGGGLPPYRVNELLNKKLNKDLLEDDLINLDSLM